MDIPSILGLVVRHLDDDNYYQIIGCFLGGDFVLRSADGEVFDCPSEEIKLVNDVIYTPCGFLFQGSCVNIARESGVFFVHHISPLRNLIYLQRSTLSRFPFPVLPTEITKIIKPVKG